MVFIYTVVYGVYIFMVYVRYFGQGNNQIYGCISVYTRFYIRLYQCIFTVLYTVVSVYIHNSGQSYALSVLQSVL